MQTSLDELRDEKQESMNDSIMKNEECLTNEEYLAELETARSALSAERSNVASTDVLLWESKMLLGNMRRDLKDALEKKKMYYNRQRQQKCKLSTISASADPSSTIS